MRMRKRGLALALAAAMALSDCGGMGTLAAEGGMAAGMPEAENTEVSLQSGTGVLGGFEDDGGTDVTAGDRVADSENGKADAEQGEAAAGADDSGAGAMEDRDTDANADSSVDADTEDSSDAAHNIDGDSDADGNMDGGADTQDAAHSVDTGIDGNPDAAHNADDDTDSHIDTAADDTTDAQADQNPQSELPALRIGQIKEGEELPDEADATFTYDQPISLGQADSVVLFVNYQADALLEAEEGTLVWSILRGKSGMEEGSVSLLQEEDDWTGYETVTDAPYFTMTEYEMEENPYHWLVRLAAVTHDDYEEDGRTAEYRHDGDDQYYIRAAYYLGTGEDEEAFYAATTVHVVTGEEALGSEDADSDQTQEAVDAEAGADQNTPETEDEAADMDAADTDLDGDGALGQEELSDENTEQTLDDEAAEAEGGTGEAADGEAEDAEAFALFEEETVTSLSLDKSNISMKPGETEKVTATVDPAGMQEKVVWTSGDTSVATVDADGVITAQAEGKAQISAVCGDQQAAVKVEVMRADTDKLLDLSGAIWVAGFEQESDALVYTGQKVTQDIRVYYNDILLKEKTDYTLSYKNNVNAAAYNAAKAPSVTINLKGQYSGSRTLYYTIKPMELNRIDPSATGQTDSPGYVQTIVYSKKLKLPTPELKFGKLKLKAKKDFVCDYSVVPEDDKDSLRLPEDYADGDAYDYGKTYAYVVNGIGNYTGSIRMQLVVVQDKNLNFNTAVVKLDQKQYEYHGEPLTEADVKLTSVKVNGKDVEGLYAYDVCAADPTGAYVLVYPNKAGENAGYRGSKKVSLKLVGDRNIKEAVLGEKWQASMVFSQKTLDEAGGFYQEKTGVLTFGSGEPLTEGQDYTVKYSNAKKVGKVTVTFTGKGRYKGSLKQQYQIMANTEQMNYRLIPGKNVTRKGDTLTVEYQKGGAAPEFTVKDSNNHVLKNKTDYTVKYTNNKVPGETMTCTFTGKGNYKGYSETVELMVEQGDLGKATISVPDKAYSTKANAWKSKVTLKDVNGKALKAGTDYVNEVEYSYAGMESGQLPVAGAIVMVTVHGTGCYKNEIKGTYRIYENSISKLKVTIDAQEYTGEEITLTPRWENMWEYDIHVYANAADQKKQKEIMDECYEIVGYKNNIKSGNAQVTMRGIGAYGGTKTCTFKIQKKKYQINRVKKITLDKTNLSMRLADKKMELTATLVPEANWQQIANTTILWSSSNSKVATVAANVVDGPVATVTFLKEGTTTITATAQDGSKKAQCKLTIVDVPIFKENGETIKGKAGETCQLHVEWEENQTPDKSKLKWSSNNSDRVSVALVNETTAEVTMKKVGAAIITLRVGSYTQQCTVLVMGDEEEQLPEGKCLTYEQKPGTADDAIEINKLLRQWEWNPGMCDYLYIPAGVYKIGATITSDNGFGGIVLTDNQKLIMSPSALLVAIGNSSTHYRIIYAFGRENVTISGGQIIGERDSHTGKGGEAGHGIQIDGCKNVHISDVEISKCWGDGIYLGAYSGDGKPSCNGVTIENCILHHNRRSNLSITDANNVTINHCEFNYANGTDPQYGIDIEHNYRTTQHVKIYNSTFKGNKKGSMGIIKAANDIRLENCTLDGAFYNMAGKNVVLKNTTIKGEIVDAAGGIRRE